MIKKIFSLVAAAALVTAVHAQVVVLDTFNAGQASGPILPGSSWIGNVTQDATFIIVGGTAKDVNGWEVNNASIDASGMNFVALTARVDAGNQANSFVIRFSDDFLNTEIVSVNLVQEFVVGQMATFYIPISWTSGIDVTNITSWSIGGGGTGVADFRMTFENLELTATASPIPEPATFAALIGLFALGLVAYRRRLASAA